MTISIVWVAIGIVVWMVRMVKAVVITMSMVVFVSCIFVNFWSV